MDSWKPKEVPHKYQYRDFLVLLATKHSQGHCNRAIWAIHVRYMQLAQHIHTHASLMRGLDWANTTTTIVLGIVSQNFLNNARDNNNQAECSSPGNVAIYDKQFPYDTFHIT